MALQHPFFLCHNREMYSLLKRYLNYNQLLLGYETGAVGMLGCGCVTRETVWVY
jgi:hypothetical protein